MYFIPLVLLAVVLLIALAWAPIFAAVIFVVGFAIFLIWVGLRRRSDEQAPGSNVAAQTTSTPRDSERGIWGEKDPDA